MPKDTGKKLADMLYGQPFDVPTPENLRLGQQLIEQELREKAARDAKLTPLDKAKAAYEAAKMMGSAAVAGIGSIPTRIVYGPEAAEKYVTSRISIPETEKGMDYVQNVGDFLEQLETKYKLPPILPEAMALQHLTGPATKQATRAAKQKAMQAAKAGERYAERKVPQIMERGGAGADVLSGLSRNTQSPLIVYHGSPHKFPPTAKNPLGEFDSTKIGTGEGAQAYGHGHYTSEAKEVGRGYQPRSPEYEKKLIKLYNKAQSSRNYSMMEVLEDAMLHSDPEDILKRFANPESEYTPEHAKAAQDFANWYAKNPPEVGSLYRVDLADEIIPKMLDWNAKFENQHPDVQAAILKYWADNPSMRHYGDPTKMTGEGIYGSARAASLGPEGGAKANLNPSNEAASMDLRYYGIPGIKYLDESHRTSSNVPEGVTNFVVFPGGEDFLNILERKKEGGAVHISDNPDVMQLELAGGGLVKGLAKAAKAKKASEVLGEFEGHPLLITQSDRTKVGGKWLGGPGFSGLQQTVPEYKQAEAAWGVAQPATAKTILGGYKQAKEQFGKEPLVTAMIGTPTQHQSNKMVFEELHRMFTKSAKEGNLDPDLLGLINDRLRNAVNKEGKNIFPEDVSILDKNFRKVADTFDKRAVASSVMGGTGVGGKKGQIIDYDAVIRHTTDPLLLDAPTGALGNRAFTLSGGLIDRPDLHPAFPSILQGEDIGQLFAPVPRELVMRDFIEKTMREKGRTPGFMDYTRGYPPTQLLTEDILTELQKKGYAKGGAVSYAEGGEITADDLILEERKL